MPRRYQSSNNKRKRGESRRQMHCAYLPESEVHTNTATWRLDSGLLFVTFTCQSTLIDCNYDSLTKSFNRGFGVVSILGCLTAR